MFQIGRKDFQHKFSSEFESIYSDVADVFNFTSHLPSFTFLPNLLKPFLPLGRTLLYPCFHKGLIARIIGLEKKPTETNRSSTRIARFLRNLQRVPSK